MKRLLVVAVLVAAVSYPAHAMLGPGGTQRMPGQNGGGVQLKCKSNQYLYHNGNGQLSCVNKGQYGATAHSTSRPIIGGNGGGVHILNTKGGVRVQCPVGQRTYVGSRGFVSCINSGLLGATRTGSNGGGEQVVCNENQQRYVGANGRLSCIARGSLGSSRAVMNTSGGIQRMPGSNGGGVQHGFGYNGGGERQLIGGNGSF